ncbi:unnamed protein product [Cuscuta campestris]|uniref:Myb-like domain-containing protein n=1 Tax=Cuscuta campestris TaxID=132261 RepID=A0A484LDM7_9ASTE|nr:unnamed protein product [Cuscuta campestris]
MEFLDEDARPRFLLQSKPLPQSPAGGGGGGGGGESDQGTTSLHLPTVFISLSISIPVLALALLHFTSEPLNSILLWLSISLLIGPFAPLSVTAGDIRVGLGPPVQLDDPADSEPEIRKSSKKSAKPFRKSVQSESLSGSAPTGSEPEPERINSFAGKSKKEERVAPEEKDWSEGDVELLKKLLGKHPVGKPGRWEAIAEGFNGRHRVEGVIKQAKELGEKKANNASDSYQKFLKDRKQIDSQERGGDGSEEEAKGEDESGGGGWTGGEDLALLNALKAFPKEAAMRWEKIATAVPGKGKAACMRRVSELKRDFRSSKAAASSAVEA